MQRKIDMIERFELKNFNHTRGRASFDAIKFSETRMVGRLFPPSEQ